MKCQNEKISTLCKEWKRRSKLLFKCASKAKSGADRRRMEFGAMTNFNCALELEKVVNSR
jgi:hypothetical protein